MVGDPGPCPAFWALAKGRDEVIDVSKNQSVLLNVFVFITYIHEMSKRTFKR